MEQTIEIHETDKNQYCPYLVILPIGAIIRWSAGYHSPEKDKAMRDNALNNAARIVAALRTSAEVIDLLSSAREAATLKSAAFGQFFVENPNYPTTEEEVTPFIRERVALHHDTWIIGMIDEAIETLRPGSK